MAILPVTKTLYSEEFIGNFALLPKEIVLEIFRHLASFDLFQLTRLNRHVTVIFPELPMQALCASTHPVSYEQKTSSRFPFSTPLPLLFKETVLCYSSESKIFYYDTTTLLAKTIGIFSCHKLFLIKNNLFFLLDEGLFCYRSDKETCEGIGVTSPKEPLWWIDGKLVSVRSKHRIQEDFENCFAASDNERFIAIASRNSGTVLIYDAALDKWIPLALDTGTHTGVAIANNRLVVGGEKALIVCNLDGSDVHQLETVDGYTFRGFVDQDDIVLIRDISLSQSLNISALAKIATFTSQKFLEINVFPLMRLNSCFLSKRRILECSKNSFCVMDLMNLSR